MPTPVTRIPGYGIGSPIAAAGLRIPEAVGDAIARAPQVAATAGLAGRTGRIRDILTHVVMTTLV